MIIVRTCNTCGATPCGNPMFCAACRLADRRHVPPTRPADVEPTESGAEIRKNRDFTELSPGAWSDNEAFFHLKGTFDLAARAHPDMFEPYVAMLVEVDDQATQQQIMREGLRSTIKQRYPGSE